MQKRIPIADHLLVDRCSHCNRVGVSIKKLNTITTKNTARIEFTWGVFGCEFCGGLMVARVRGDKRVYDDVFPDSKSIDDNVPERPRKRLQEASDTLHAPGASMMSTATAIDWMLKHNGYKDGNLYHRIEKAADDHLLTAGMKEWAHAIRLEANMERHADEDYQDPSIDDASRCLDFGLALAEILFVLPARAKRGRTPDEGAQSE